MILVILQVTTENDIEFPEYALFGFILYLP